MIKAERGRISDRLRFDTLAKCGFRCHYCGAAAVDAELVVDHVMPVAAGGPTEPANLVAACRPCNEGKTSKIVECAPVPDSLPLEAIAVGRPAMGHRRINAGLPKASVVEIDALVGTHGRAGFIRDAVERELERRERVSTKPRDSAESRESNEG